jgi:16S rRNA (guanine527-N7)-methyltransferase
MAANRMRLVERAASALQWELSAETLADIGTWLERLVDWNERVDLTAARSDEELVDLMLADALVLAANIEPAARVVDVGTGAGGPGLALALLRSDLNVTLVEPAAKRVSFLRTVVGTLNRTNVLVQRARGEELAGRCDWDVAISRATLQPDSWLDLAMKLLPAGGGCWVLLATAAPPTRTGAAVEVDRSYVWPLTRVMRRAVSYRILG